MADAGGVSSQQPLYAKYPISSQWEFTLKDGQSVKGEVYCTDPVADLVILQDSQNDIRMISVSNIDAASRDEASEDTTIEQKKVEAVHAKKAMEEREKRAIRMAQESLKHLNPKADPKGQLVFDRLLKACNEVVWKNESIIVLDSIKVDPPYTPNDCKVLQSSAPTKQGSLDRVQKIVSSVTGA
jgi:hypothetical protein